MKPTFTINFPGTVIAPCIVEFTSTPQAPEEEIYLFDFGDGTLYNCGPGERIVRHTYEKAGIYSAKGWSQNPKTMSDPISIIIRAPDPVPVPDPIPDPVDNTWGAYFAWLWNKLKSLFGY